MLLVLLPRLLQDLSSACCVCCCCCCCSDLIDVCLWGRKGGRRVILGSAKIS